MGVANRTMMLRLDDAAVEPSQLKHFRRMANYGTVRVKTWWYNCQNALETASFGGHIGRPNLSCWPRHK
jgi:hypothetical protein